MLRNTMFGFLFIAIAVGLIWRLSVDFASISILIPLPVAAAFCAGWVIGTRWGLEEHYKSVQIWFERSETGRITFRPFGWWSGYWVDSEERRRALHLVAAQSRQQAFSITVSVVLLVIGLIVIFPSLMGTLAFTRPLLWLLLALLYFAQAGWKRWQMKPVLAGLEHAPKGRAHAFLESAASAKPLSLWFTGLCFFFAITALSVFNALSGRSPLLSGVGASLTGFFTAWLAAMLFVKWYINRHHTRN